MMLKAAIFDLDGTLVDSSEGITNSVRHAEKKLGLTPCKKGEELRCAGLPLAMMFAEMYHLEGSALAEALEGYREYYTEKGHKQLKPFEGVREALALLKNRGVKLAVATSKRERYTHINLQDTGLARFFDFVSCANPDDTSIDKTAIIARAIKDTGVSPGECIMVGDRVFDVEGAHAALTRCIIVSYGFGSTEEIRNSKADFIAKTPMDAAEIILKLDCCVDT